jgi:hypothetical protein
MIGEDHDLSILALRWRRRPEIPRSSSATGRSLTYWVRKIPTLRQAATLLTEHGGPPRKSGVNLTSSTPSVAKMAYPASAASRSPGSRSS